MQLTDELLFAKASLQDQLEEKKKSALADVEHYDANKLLNSIVDDLVLYFVARHEVDPPQILESEIEADHAEHPVDVSNRFDYGAPFGRPTYAPGGTVTLHVPISGELGLIHYHASASALNPPRGRTLGNRVVLSYTAPQKDLDVAKENLNGQLEMFRRYLKWTADDITQFNSQLPSEIRRAVEARRERVLANQNLVRTLGYPLRRRDHAPKTYTLPDVRRRIILAPPPASTAPYVPEPALSNEIYDQILSVLGNMVQVMERSPAAFIGLGEQDLRTHFLVQLNGQFERATGETFSGHGKTDIWLRELDRSVFVAECKFWKGSTSLTQAIDQLLGYVVWRDAKAALLMFNRNADFTTVVKQIPGLIAEHSQTIGPIEKIGETVFRSRLRQLNDSSRELMLTTLVYNVPTTSRRAS